MKKANCFPLIAGILFLAAGSCRSHDAHTIATDSLSIATGQKIFTQSCASCHNFRQDGIGPQLSGVTSLASPDWLGRFIKDPHGLIASGDPEAKKLFEKYHTEMPSFTALTDQEIGGLLAYLNTQKNGPKKPKLDPLAIADPVPRPIPMSDVQAGLELVAEIPPSRTGKDGPLTRIAKLDCQPGADSLFVLDLRGKLYRIQNGQPQVYFDMAKEEPAFINEPGLATGFGSFAFHPGFAKNGLFYTTHTEPAGTKTADFRYDDSIKVQLQWVLTEWKTDHPEAGVFKGKSRELLRINFVSGIHGVQEITFHALSKPGDEDYGLLYIGVGDGGCVENGYPFLAHNPEGPWGTILRIDPKGRNSANKQYGIPANNPFVHNADPRILKEVYAYGFRNPNRISWSRSGLMLASNIGQARLEVINIIRAGQDYGWPLREGNFAIHPREDINQVYALPPNDSIYKFSYPVAEYDHDDGHAVSGGFEYNGSDAPALKGKYLFGDIDNGRLYYVEMSDLQPGRQAPIKEWQISAHGKAMKLQEFYGRSRADIRFGMDGKGELYILAKPDGKIYRLVKAG